MVVTLEETIDELEGKFDFQKVHKDCIKMCAQNCTWWARIDNAWKHTFLDEVHEAKLRNKESEQSLDQIFNEVATA